jgi:N utilization substance protein A
MSSVIEQAIRQICDEKGLEYESVLATIEAALAAAYRKDFGDRYHNLEAEFDPETAAVRVFDVKTVVPDITDEEREALEKKEAERMAAREAAHAIGDNRPEKEEVAVEGMVKFNPKTDIMESQAKILKLSAKVGDVLRTELPTAGEFGRMAAMTAKQVITQKLREAEREIVFNEYKGQEGEVLVGTVQRREGRIVLVDIGRTAGILKPEDQMSNERYQSGDRIKVYVREVSVGPRGPQILLSRTHEGLVRRLFEIEIPEVAEGIVVLKAIAREAGARTKVAVTTTDTAIDPIGACIGQRGSRIQTIISEISGEKIDVIEWSEEPKEFIRHALAPSKISVITIHDDERSATALVAADQLSLAIGRGGQNVRLAAKLTGWKLNIQEDGAVKITSAEVEAAESSIEPVLEAPVAEGNEAAE